jgi:hypothetical protein
VIINEHSATKKKISVLLGDKFDPNLSAAENMDKNRFYKLWDCGQEVYSLKT